ncbi:bacterial Ig-like domain-containing protein, partial [Enterococcus faecalis]|nr:bacterial Ig-like domain-containing protein [Enterococcus faecalis]
FTVQVFVVNANKEWASSNIVKVTVKEGPTAEVIPFKTNLNLGTNRYSAKKFVKNVKLDGKLISEREYTVSFVEHNLAKKVGKFNFKVKVTINATNAEAILEIPMEVLFGNTLVLKGTSYQPVLGLSTYFYGGDNYKLEPSRVKDTSVAVNEINSSFDRKYLSVDVYRVEDDSSALVNLNSYYNFSKKGTDNIDDAYKDFIEQNYTPGDVLKVMHEEVLDYPQMVNVWKTEKQESPQVGYVNKEAYYELRTEGFSPLHLNQLEAKNGIIPLDANEEYLNKHIMEYIDTKGYSNIKITKFLNFPDTKQSGKTEGEIQVIETLKSGKELRYSYKVSFTVDDTLTAKAVPTSINLATNTNHTDAKSMITEVKSGNRLLSKEDYSVIIKDTVDTMTVGSREVVVVVSAVGKTVEVKVPVAVEWGNALKINGTYYNTVMALTSHKSEQSSYTIIPARGVEEGTIIHQDYINKKYVSVALIRPTGKSLEKETPFYQITKNGSDSIKDTYKSFTRQEANSGDIIQIDHEELKVSDGFVELSNGNSLIKPTTGYLDKRAYFEIDNTGSFQPIHVNQLKMKDVSIDQDTTNAEIDKDIKDNPGKYFENPGRFQNITFVKFNNYPDTSNHGKKTAVLLFEETLKSGENVQWEYEIQVTIIENKMSIKTKDITLNKWDAYSLKDSFVSATDKEGKTVSVDDKQITTIGDKLVDSSKPGKYKVTFILTIDKKEVRSEAIVTVENKWVNVTIPTKMLFFSDMKSGKKDKVISESYSITNNSDNTSLEVEMASFSVAKDSEVTYLSPSEENPTKPENKLRLNLLVNGQPKVQGLTNETKTTHLVDVDVKKSINLTFEGQYFNANSEDSPEAKSSMVLKFNIKK